MPSTREDYMRKVERRVKVWLKRNSANISDEDAQKMIRKFIKESGRMYDEIELILNPDDENA